MAAAWTGLNSGAMTFLTTIRRLLALASKATAYVTVQLANYAFAARK